MEDKNGLNDIILNKSSKNNSTKKILLTIATFAIILIVVVVVMNQFSAKKETRLPHPPEVKQVVVEEVFREPELQTGENSAAQPDMQPDNSATEQEEVVEVKPQPSAKQSQPIEAAEPVVQSVFEDPEIIEEPDYTAKSKPKTVPAPAPVVKEKKQVLKAQPFRPSGKYDPNSKRVVEPAASTAATSGQYYVQVGSFAKYAPSKSFLEKISNRGYTYTFHKVTRDGRTINKVLVGPFRTQSAAREALPVIKNSVEPGAFLIKL